MHTAIQQRTPSKTGPRHLVNELRFWLHRRGSKSIALRVPVITLGCMRRLVFLLSFFVLIFIAGLFSDLGLLMAESRGSHGWIFEGWACKPDLEKSRPGIAFNSPAQYCKREDCLVDTPFFSMGCSRINHQFRYSKFESFPDTSLRKGGDEQQKEQSCRANAARAWQKNEMYRVLIYEVRENVSGVENNEVVQRYIKTELYLLRSSQTDDEGIVNCCAINAETGTCYDSVYDQYGRIVQPKWNSCDCVGYVKIKSGEEAIERIALDVEQHFGQPRSR
ncbi:MAG: hypothetical protein KDK39_03900 [Leptospiraceae bacterium]|nr:hypothetical protein [Leptospiraceae bacterium]